MSKNCPACGLPANVEAVANNKFAVFCDVCGIRVEAQDQKTAENIFYGSEFTERISKLEADVEYLNTLEEEIEFLSNTVDNLRQELHAVNNGRVPHTESVVNQRENR